MTIEGFFPATTMPDSDWWTALWPAPAQVLAQLGIAPRLDVIDLCCGDGLFTSEIARTAARAIAIDVDPRMLDLARTRVAATGVRHCEFIEGDAYAIADLVSWQADVVLMANTFHGVPDKQRLVRAVVEALKPAGRFIVINWHRRPREETRVLGKARGPKTELRMEPRDVAAAVASAALQLEHIVELPPYHYGAIFAATGRKSMSPPGFSVEQMTLARLRSR